jgi:hypothetical protein
VRAHRLHQRRARQRKEIRAGIERMQGPREYFVQTAHPGAMRLERDTAVAVHTSLKIGHMRDGRSERVPELFDR